MALQKTLSNEIVKISNFAKRSVTNCRISPSTSPKPSSSNRVTRHDRSDLGGFLRFFHKRVICQPDFVTGISSSLYGRSVIEKIQSEGCAGERIPLGDLIRWTISPVESAQEKSLPIEAVRKLVKIGQLEAVKSKLKEIDKTWMSYSEFRQACKDWCLDEEHADWAALALDESGFVIVMGNIVLIRPDQVMKAVREIVPFPVGKSHGLSMELEELKKEKEKIKEQAKNHARRELWCGLGFLAVQTVGFMRLTFWELSWDVMEPICFYVTSVYFMAGYAFFLTTSKEPSFEGFYQSRLDANLNRLMRIHKFDLQRYNELKQIC